MKKILIILFLALSFIRVSYATNRYVSTTGSDAAAGTISAPWLTWNKAFTSTSVMAGDTVFIRGGIYELPEDATTGIDVMRAGTSGSWIVYCNYPGEVPILDCEHADVGTGNTNMGVAMSTNYGPANYIKLKGLTVRNVLQKHNDHEVYTYGFYLENGFFTLENCTVYNSQGWGVYSYFFNGFPVVDGAHTIINCDVHDCVNSDAAPGYMPGNGGAGFSSQNFYGNEGHAYVRGCRAWGCGDQGFSWNGENYCQIDSCWSFDNGRLEGGGEGFKLGWHDTDYGSPNPVVRNCIAAYNKSSGMTTNDNGMDVAEPMSIYNNTVYHNGGYGFVIYNTVDIDADELKRDFKNNIAYDNVSGAVFLGPSASYTHVTNSWDNPPNPTVTDADFLSVDSTGLSGPRQSNGNLPVLNFLKLAATSDCIDVGTDVGLPKEGAGYDLGAYEYVSAEGAPASVVKSGGKTVRHAGKTTIAK